ncbi:integrin alpha [Bathymodiolus thermophilus thioautotrophic gill symbiont]|uniref:Uncharacterized protein n=3 Tax=Bathymodiolus thermophilus thioautotrophic gill symbiont TaxID=2360 RepID=A0A8H8XAZ6_9GAMM|nr:integrin alpha [Bathymodiolus thermophilus thioautotrophic gill symbiont]CAB5498602.1 hypothetical protein THERMOS_874 [Bathymodiolus thermophilus thioautotrophic gill symbiont]
MKDIHENIGKYNSYGYGDRKHSERLFFADSAEVISGNTGTFILGATSPIFSSGEETQVKLGLPSLSIIYTAETADENVIFTLADKYQEKFTMNENSELYYRGSQINAGNDEVNSIDTDVEASMREFLAALSVVTTTLEPVLEHQFYWNGKGADDLINARELTIVALSGAITVIGTVKDLSISSILFKQGSTLVHRIDFNLLTIVDNIWTLVNDTTWASKLSQVDTIIINLLGKDGFDEVITFSVSSVAPTIDIIAPATLSFSFTDTGSDQTDGITSNAEIIVSGLEVGATWFYCTDGGDSGIAILGEGNSFTLDPDSYAIGDIRVWQKDLAGNASEIYSNAHAIIIITETTADIPGTTADGGSSTSTASEVSSAHGFTINTGASWDTRYPRDYGQAVSSVGDVNGDGMDDLIVGLASQHYKWGWDTGESYVVFGKVDGKGVNVNNLGSGGFTIIGRAGNSLNGYAVSSAGDVNGDGLDDLIIGAPKEWHTWGIQRSGAAYVVFGKTDTSSVLLKDVYNGTGGFAIKGYIYESYAGASVSAAGDINNDGLDDVIVGINNDGLDDVIIGINNDDVGGIITSAEHQKFAIFGKKSTSSVSLSAIANGTADDQGFVINSDNLCPPVTSSADFNGDGFIDSISSEYWGTSLYARFGKFDGTWSTSAEINANNENIGRSIDFQGDKNADKDDTLTGTEKDELFVSGLGDDILTGNGGTDVFNSGMGNDTIIINKDNLSKLSGNIESNNLLSRVNGGNGTDTLALDGKGLTLDLTLLDNSRIKDIEIIDLTGSGNNTLRLNLSDLLSISSETDVLKIFGNAGDVVEAFGFIKSLTGSTAGVCINAGSGTAELWIANGITIVQESTIL